MKKILFIATRNPFSGRYSGDVIRSLKIVNLLKKKYSLNVVCLDKKSELKNKNKNILAFKDSNFFLKIFYCIVSFLKFEPIQFGLFYSREMMECLRENAYKYDCLFFYHIRSSQYLPTNFRGKTIIEMGDLYSENYLQTFNNLNIFNPLKYIYLLESILITKTEKKVFSNFDKVTLFSKNEVKKINLNIKGKILQVDECIDIVKNKYKFSKDNFRILFVGNLDYLPNFLACKDFIKNDLPFLKKKIPQIKFSIIGNVTKLRKFLLSGKPEVEVLGFKKDISNFKLRKGMPIGSRVTLRGDKMYEFLDRFITSALPRVRDFRGVNPKGFDGRGNYNLGIKEQIIFPEIDIDKVNKITGMDITFVTSAPNDEEAKSLLTEFGLPFKK